MPFDEDFSIFTDVDDFGHTCTFAGINVPGIYDREFVQVVIGGVPVDGYHPVFHCADQDIVGAEIGTDVIVTEHAAIVDGSIGQQKAYKIIDIQPDGTGMTLVVLQAQ